MYDYRRQIKPHDLILFLNHNKQKHFCKFLTNFFFHKEKNSSVLIVTYAIRAHNSDQLNNEKTQQHQNYGRN